MKLNTPFINIESLIPNIETQKEIHEFKPEVDKEEYSAAYAVDEKWPTSSSSLDENPVTDEFEPVFEPMSDAEILNAPSGLTPASNKEKTKKNIVQVLKSGVSPATILNELSKTISLSKIRGIFAVYNLTNPTNTYPINPSGVDIDAVFTEAVYQFQVKNYLDPKEHDGIAGQSTLDTLGIYDHKLKMKLNSSAFYGQHQLDQIKEQISKGTGKEFTASNWFEYIVRPAWLGIKISDGVHVLFFRKLQEAEAWLKQQPQYQGMTPVELGTALGFRAGTRYSGARLSSKKEAMHGFGLAIDIDAHGNPWVGAGWIQTDTEKLKERTRLLATLRKASVDNLPGSSIFAYLDSVAQSVGDNTSDAFNILKQRNDEFITYLKNNKAELTYWQTSATFSTRDPLNGFLNLHHDLVFALREKAGLAWGAIDFGPRASGDVMHFDLRTLGVGKVIGQQIRASIPKSGHPTTKDLITKEIANEEEERIDVNEELDYEYHEAIEEADIHNDD